MPTSSSFGDTRTHRPSPGPSAAGREVVIDVPEHSQRVMRNLLSVATCTLLVASGVAVGIWAALQQEE